MQFICLCSREQIADEGEFAKVLELDPIGVAFHGEVTDRIWRDGKIDTALEPLAQIRDAGVQVGLSTHNPEVIDHIEEKEWDLDFYMACFYNLSREKRESALVSGTHQQEEFLEEDPPRMCETIRATSKTCLAFKILGASRKCGSQEEVREAFRFAFDNIKPQDAVIVGMFPKREDQARLNVEHARAALSEGAGEAA